MAEGSDAARPPEMALRDQLVEKARALQPKLHDQQAAADKLGRVHLVGDAP